LPEGSGLKIGRWRDVLVCDARMSGAQDVIERLVKSFGFSVFCFAVWGSLTAVRARALVAGFTWMEVIWLAYNATIAVLFLIRTRPSVVSLNPVHWLVALLTSFSGLFFDTQPAGLAAAGGLCDALILIGLAASGTAAIALRRSYDFLPALRGVSTGWLFKVIRHPMYLASIVIRLGYLGKHASVYNAAVFVIMVVLYDRRAVFEEQIMNHDARYREYAERVRYRFVPGVY
jgi:protein-S-isoprenylcysteine O-methyltransferase Ste14